MHCLMRLRNMAGPQISDLTVPGHSHSRQWATHRLSAITTSSRWRSAKPRFARMRHKLTQKPVSRRLYHSQVSQPSPLLPILVAQPCPGRSSAGTPPEKTRGQKKSVAPRLPPSTWLKAEIGFAKTDVHGIMPAMWESMGAPSMKEGTCRRFVLHDLVGQEERLYAVV
jgi:hypothetical protein